MQFSAQVAQQTFWDLTDSESDDHDFSRRIVIVDYNKLSELEVIHLKQHQHIKNFSDLLAQINFPTSAIYENGTHLDTNAPYTHEPTQLDVFVNSPPTQVN